VARHVHADSAEFRELWIIHLSELYPDPQAALPNQRLEATAGSRPD
jgi:hypothetical protein